MSLEDVKKKYKETIEKEASKSSSLSGLIFRVGMLRLAIVVACLFGCYFLWGNTLPIVLLVLASVVSFLLLMLYHNRLFTRRLYSDVRSRNAQQELNAIDYDFSAFDGASECIDGSHHFSLDLDLFGDRSFFQSLNRTVTSFGKDGLIEAVLSPLQAKDAILLRQEAIQELVQKQKLADHFRTIGNMSACDSLNLKDLSSVFSDVRSTSHVSKFWKWMRYVVPALYLVWTVFYLLNLIPGETFMSLWMLLLVFSSVPLAKVRRVLSVFDKKTASLETYSKLFETIETEKFDSPLLKTMQTQLLSNSATASSAIAQLKSNQENLSLSLIFPVFMLLNPFLLWNVRYLLSFHKWVDSYSDKLDAWFKTISQFDALVSLSIFAYTHPDYVYPEVLDSFAFEGKQLGHPMLKREVCVRNDIEMAKKPYFLVVTGANMAGKSTYLRTVGINHTMACMGMPICGESLRFYPCSLLTNLRTVDSLADSESYFFAELKRLKMIIDRLQSGEELFIILDEILKGTNSEDKQKGSLALMRQLVALDGTGIIATHDLLLGDLEKEYPKDVKNYRFEADMKNEQLTFSYKIREGVAQNMNACFLMKQMGITGL